MAHNFIAWLIFAAFVVNIYAIKSVPIKEPIRIGPSCDENYCLKQSTKCLPVGPNDCEVGYRYHLSDPSTCNCCPYCEKCDPLFCSLALCRKPVCKRNEVYVPGDGLCTCCGSCQKVECDPSRCNTVRCAGDIMENCKDDEIFVNANGICDCCGGVCKKAFEIKEAELIQAA